MTSQSRNRVETNFLGWNPRAEIIITWLPSLPIGACHMILSLFKSRFGSHLPTATGKGHPCVYGTLVDSPGMEKFFLPCPGLPCLQAPQTLGLTAWVTENHGQRGEDSTAAIQNHHLQVIQRRKLKFHDPRYSG